MTAGLVADSATYNNHGELSSHSVSVDGTEVLRFDYTRNGQGRITDIDETTASGTQTDAYTFDAASRLTGATRGGSQLFSFAYDANGNRTDTTSTGAAAGQHDDQDRLTSWGPFDFEHSRNGERTRRTPRAGGQAVSYDFDVFGHLLGAQLADGTDIDYVIDGRGRRVGKVVDGALVSGFLYRDELRVVAELDGSNQVVSEFVHATGSTTPDLMIRGGTTYRIVSDHVGSPRLVIDTADGTVAQAIEYDPFGAVLSDTNPGFQPFGFAGGLYDSDTGLVRFGAREYDPMTGRWMTKDPLRFGGGDTNLYLYALGDPVNFTDPTGEIPPIIIAAAVLGLGTGTGAAMFEELTNIFERAVDAAAANAGRNSGHADALQHCIASCNVARQMGHATAQLAGWVNELNGSLRQGEERQARADEWNNTQGRACADEAESESDCINGCVGQLRAGWLETEWNH